MKNNSGRITVLLCLMSISFLLVGLSVTEVIRICVGRSTFAEASKGAMDNLKAGYCKELFDEYHLLFLDSSDGAGGEAGLEEEVKKYYEYTLCNTSASPVYDVNIEITNKIGAMDNKMAPLKTEITEYMEQYAPVYLVDKLIEILGDYEDCNDDVKTKFSELMNDNTKGNAEYSGEDPRKALKKAKGEDELSEVSGSKTISTECIDLKGLPSKNLIKDEAEDKEVSFDDISILENLLDTTTVDSKDSLKKYGAGIGYALTSFTNFTSENSKENHKFKYEVEYIICGKNSDYKNMRSVVNLLTLHRLPFNLVHLMMDADKMAKVDTICAALALIPGVPIGVVKCLLVGCWAYAETLVDVKTLLAGKHVPLLKTKETWMTDIYNLGKIFSLEGSDYSGLGALTYEDYLMIFLAEKGEKIYYRMADVIELNMQNYDENFKFENMIYAWTMDVSGSGEQKYFDFINNNISEEVDYNTLFKYEASLEVGY